jgi:restriction system protein
MKTQRGPAFIRFFSPLIQALHQLGGSGKPTEVYDRIVQNLKLPDEKVAETTKSGATRVENQIHWARFYLARAGYIDSSQRGVWRLTEKGLATDSLEGDEAYALFKTLHAQLQSSNDRPQATQLSQEPVMDEVGIQPITDYRTALLATLVGLPPGGFERVCQRLLRESGFERVTVTGRSGDGGIDGIGVVQVTPFVSFKALFQCKRYVGSVGASQVRDFRGAMAGRADKGIIITTGTFTRDARDEAVREGVPPIELVDGEKLVELFESLQLGLKPRKAFDIDQEFFREYR